MRNILFGTGEFYHIYNRGVDKRITFLESEDYRHFTFLAGRSKHEIGTGVHLVNLHAYTLMSNHFHLLLEQVCDGGVAQFMQRLSTSYTRWFNHQHDRVGSLFETTYKAKHVDTNAYLAVVAAYIHRNPLDATGINSINDLDTYEWSSYPHYREMIKNPIVDGGMLFDFFGGKDYVQRFHQQSFSLHSDDFED